MSAPVFVQVAQRVIARTAAAFPVGAGCRCCLCQRRVRRFLPYRHGGAPLPAVLREKDVVGSDVANFECPACGCHDRERHLALYLAASRLTDALTSARILHFAPERRLQAFIAAMRPAEYVLGDLYPSRPGIRRVDMLDINFPDGHFDFVIANHVLEHVTDDARALGEIRRVLRPGGKAILQTPYSAALPTKFEDPAIRAEVARLQAYGQEDHVRLYGADLPSFVARQGFIDRSAGHASLLPDVDARAAGVNAREPFLLFEKPGPA